MTRVLVCGGRYFNDLGIVWGHLDAIHNTEGYITVLVHGGAPGADALATSWARYNGVPTLVFPPDWSIGKSAGPIRNQRMIDESKPDRVVAFPGGRGTKNMVDKAKAAGLPVLEIKE